MSYSFSGTNNRLKGSFTSTYADPITIACFVKLTTSTATDVFVNCGNSSTSQSDSYAVRMNSTNTYEATSFDAAAVASSTGVILNIDGVWAGIVGVWANDSDRTVYVQSTANTSNGTATRTVGDALQHIQCGENLANGADYAGLLAEVAIWNAALNVTQVGDYLGGLAASQIASANLIGYWPLSASNATQANEGVDAGGDLTVTAATFDADHPTITFGSAAPTLYLVRSNIRLA